MLPTTHTYQAAPGYNVISHRVPVAHVVLDRASPVDSVQQVPLQPAWLLTLLSAVILPSAMQCVTALSPIIVKFSVVPPTAYAAIHAPAAIIVREPNILVNPFHTIFGSPPAGHGAHAK